MSNLVVRFIDLNQPVSGVSLLEIPHVNAVTVSRQEILIVSAATQLGYTVIVAQFKLLEHLGLSVLVDRGGPRHQPQFNT